jgi:hypothetical protein
MHILSSYGFRAGFNQTPLLCRLGIYDKIAKGAEGSKAFE